MSDIPRPPPRKKRKRTYTENEDFIKIISKLGNKLDPQLIACLKYVDEEGVICDACCADKQLKGPFTKTQPVKNFSYTKLKLHILCSKYTKRLSDELKCLYTANNAIKDQLKNQKHHTKFNYNRIRLYCCCIQISSVKYQITFSI